MIGIRYFFEQRAEKNATISVFSALYFATAVDLVIDGFLLAVGFSAGHSGGVVLALALSIEVLFLVLAEQLESFAVTP